MLGEPPEEIDGPLEAWLGRIVEADRDRVELELRTLAEGLADVFETEYRMRHRNGSQRWMRARASARRGGDGPIIAGHQEDITERKTAEDVLRGSEARFRALIENCPDAVAVHRQGRFVYANERMRAMLGFPDLASVKGALLLEAIHPDDHAGVIEEARRLAAGEEASLPPREVRLRRRDGSALTVEMSSLRLSFDGEPAIFAVARDVTERKRLQAQMAQADRMASLGTLAAGVAHEINNPLTYVMANLQTMIEELPGLARQAGRLRAELERRVGPDAAAELAAQSGGLLDVSRLEEILEQMKDAYQGSARVQSIVRDLRVFGRADEERAGPVDLARALEIALKMVSHELRLRARVVQELEPVPPVHGDEGRLSQVFLNLLMNAAQAIEPGHFAENRIRVSLRRDGSEVVAEVEDTGCGIPREHLSRLFDPFFTTKPAGVGSGLGLAISRHIVEAYRGRIEVESELSRGTRVRFVLPGLLEEARSGLVEEPALAEAEGSTAQRPRILVVDDEPALCRALARALSPGYEVATAEGGRRAQEILEHDRRFDLVLCDVMMPDVSGPALHEWVRARDPHLASRIVFITGGATSEGAKSFLREVDNLVLEKPLDVKKVRSLLGRLIAPGPQPQTVERRRGARFAARGIVGVLEASDVTRRLAVVDYSESGLRVSGLAAWPAPEAEAALPLSLHRGDPSRPVAARVRFVREVRTPQGVDLCFQIVAMDWPSRETYQGWLAEASSKGNRLAH
jgi:PAS domain S-box-containing protein